MADTLKILLYAWRDGGSASSKIRLDFDGGTGTEFSSLPTSPPSTPNIDVAVTVPNTGTGVVTSGILLGDLNGTAGTISAFANGPTARFEDGGDSSWYNLEPDVVDSNSPAISAIPSGLRQRDLALKSTPFSVVLSGTTTTDGTWGAVSEYFDLWVAPYVSGVA